MKTLAEVIRGEILGRNGVLPFDRFMELALYCPNLGYYETKKDSVGRRGDFFTSVSVGSLFGELLAFQFAEWLDPLPGDGLAIVEAGAHNGQLARDVLAWLQSSRPDLFDRIEYRILEPSLSRRQWQQETLKHFAAKIQWFAAFPSSTGKPSNHSTIEPPNDLTMSPINGIIFSNELLDAFPVRRFGWDAAKKEWFEWGVRVKGAQFAWAEMATAVGELPSLVRNAPTPLLEVLPDEFAVETSPAAVEWWQCAARSLQRGKLMTADYGLTTDEFFLPSRKNGTLRAFFRHHFAADPLASPGEQDLTAHVNFSEIQQAGEEAGLITEAFSTQAKFLTGILERTVSGGKFSEWNSSRGRQFQTLTHPEHLGRAFRVLVQARP